MHADAAKLPGPLGLYEAPLRVRGVVGTLRRCEVSTVHTFLVFSAVGHPDVYVDLSPKQARRFAARRPCTRARRPPSGAALRQFFVMGEWMEDAHYEACRAAGMWAEQADFFVGPADELERLFTLGGLRDNMVAVYEAHGSDVSSAPFADPAALQQMHTLRNQVLFALHDVALRRRLCTGQLSDVLK